MRPGVPIGAQIDLRVIPFDRLRAAGVLDVLLSGPPPLLLPCERWLREVFARERIVVRNWGRVPGPGVGVPLTFVVMPPPPLGGP